MKFFPNPEKSAEKKLADTRDNAKANLDRLAFRLTDAEQAVITRRSAAQRAALNGDDGALDLAETAERAALHRLDSFRAAHAEADKLLAGLETQIGEMLDQRTRAATAAATNELAAEMIQAGAAYDASTAALNEVCTRAQAVIFEATGLSVFTANSRIEVGAAIPVVAEVLRQHGRAVLNGSAKAEMPKPASPVIELVAKPVVEPEAAKPASPAVFHRVDRPHYQVRVAGSVL